MLHPFTSLQQRHPGFLKVDNHELVEECDKITNMVTVPYGQKCKGGPLTNISVIHKLKSLVNIRSRPVVCVNVESFDNVPKS